MMEGEKGGTWLQSILRCVKFSPTSDHFLSDTTLVVTAVRKLITHQTTSYKPNIFSMLQPALDPPPSAAPASPTQDGFLAERVSSL